VLVEPVLSAAAPATTRAWRPALVLVEPPTTTGPSLSVVIPATGACPTLERCLGAINAALDLADEVIVVDGHEGMTPAAARNRGVSRASGDVVVFVDADVEVHVDVFRRIRAAFADEPRLTALFGSYDDDPASEGVVSEFRNLLHHHVHQGSPGAIGTFWAGLGAIRREAFVAAGGFEEHPIEDIELGMRLAACGERIVLEPELQGKHLKRWTLWSMIRTDLLIRGAPWVGLALRHRTTPKVLNLGWRHRMSALASVCAVGALAKRRPACAAAAVGALIALNRAFYRLLLRRGGPAHAAAGICLHMVHHLTGAIAIPTGIAIYVRDRRASRD
jgi:GT2 family glycosyltransferase